MNKYGKKIVNRHKRKMISACQTNKSIIGNMYTNLKLKKESPKVYKICKS